MRRSSTRKPAAATTNAGNRAAAKELERIDTLFGQYADKNEELTIGPEGIEQLCRDLGVEPTDIKILLLAWKLQAARQGYFSLEEWRRGLKAMRVDTVDKLRKALPSLQLEVANIDVFRSFYTFAFQYCLTEPRQRTLDVETACQMLELVLGDQPHVSSFITFLQEQKEYKVLTLDQWTGYLRFCEEINPDFSNYDENQAWPLLLDNYVEWAKAKQ
ncbi:hypothetical protein KP509_33G031400 [Ceratopteris richardii]|uniref:Defective in cullin neddylation protein n=1 Tax=Ceratopteris richardii TaxID=49495 RepID=A0A8T2QQ87_CERRI|nr:hypothetical protein KP509_33G031400 [Ceratopteris richardii]KAH7285512.1 hypothetical protein KP509_33G031400 [Ceratopteris richardii]KAH7285513.1 hypothetical protein KP509_33G031400 [Ceratopteris richardii]KAH7285514.1 hypothetical protein KP509_33G031400 [Ceratopteris richardii]